MIVGPEANTQIISHRAIKSHRAARGKDLSFSNTSPDMELTSSHLINVRKIRSITMPENQYSLTGENNAIIWQTRVIRINPVIG
jgi:hypothetical protein